MHRLLAAACLTFITNATVCSENLLRDPSFEEHGKAEDRVWTFSGESKWMEDTDLAHSGSHCVRARFDDGVSQQIPIRGGAAYRICGWIRRVQPNGSEIPKIKVYFLDARRGRADVQAAEIQGVDAQRWVRWETIVQAPVQATTLNLTLRAFFGGTEWFYYDDLSAEEIAAISWPARATLPDLHGCTVTVPDIADVWTDALLRIPPGSLFPVDGQLASSVMLRGEDVLVQLSKPQTLCWALVHSIHPGMNLGHGVLSSVQTSPSKGKVISVLATSVPKVELITSLQFKPASVNEVVLSTPDDKETRLNEIQFFGLQSGRDSDRDSQRFALLKAKVPNTVEDDLKTAYAMEEDRATLVAGDLARGEGTIELPAERYLNIMALPKNEPFGLGAVDLDLAFLDADSKDVMEIAMRCPEELDVNIRWTTSTDRGLKPSLARRNYATVFRTISRVENDRLAARFDVPDLAYARDEPIWITLRTQQTMTLNLAASSLTFDLIPVAEAHPEYLPQLERLTRRMYSGRGCHPPYGCRCKSA